MATLKALLILLPELLNLFKSLRRSIKKGSEIQKLKWDLKRINNAFQEKDPKKRANKLNIIFRK